MVNFIVLFLSLQTKTPPRPDRPMATIQPQISLRETARIRPPVRICELAETAFFTVLPRAHAGAISRNSAITFAFLGRQFTKTPSPAQTETPRNQRARRSRAARAYTRCRTSIPFN
jgi:hypothetical protein